MLKSKDRFTFESLILLPDWLGSCKWKHMSRGFKQVGVLFYFRRSPVIIARIIRRPGSTASSPRTRFSTLAAERNSAMLTSITFKPPRDRTTRNARVNYPRPLVFSLEQSVDLFQAGAEVTATKFTAGGEKNMFVGCCCSFLFLFCLVCFFFYE